MKRTATPGTTAGNPRATADSTAARKDALLRLDGEIRGDFAYTLVEIAKKMGETQARHVAKRLEARGLILDKWGRGWHKTWVSGRVIIEAIDRINRGGPVCADDTEI